MFKKPFNKKVGEQRTCKHCNASFHTLKPIWKCTKCVNASQKVVEQRKRAKYPKKDQYPFNNRTNEAGSRFCTIRTALSNAWKEYNKTGDKTAVIAHYDKQLKEIKGNGIWQWIWDRRSPDAKREMNPNAKTRNMIRTDYPDTRGHYEE
jgi:hypothetical protein